MRHLRLVPVYAALTGLSILPLAGCSWIDGDRISSDFHATVANAPATIQVDNAVGSIDIEAWDKPSVEIDATKRGPNYDTVNAIKISVEPNGSTLTVNTQFPQMSTNAKVEYTIHAPAHTDLKLVQSVGAIKSIGFTGSVQEHTSTGAVEATMAQLGGSQQLHIDVSVGAIKLILPANTDAAVTATTSVGGIKSDFPLSIDRTVVGQYARGKVGNGSAVAELNVSTGGIEIQRE
ncbi:MAG: hypothetical protein WBD74_14205 [Candidatus Aquilonibacter sp.]